MPSPDGVDTPASLARPPLVLPVDIGERLQLFTGPLEASTTAALASEMRWVTLPRGTVLFRQGDPGEAVFFVASGRLTVFVTRDDGHAVQIGEVGPGESVGEMALLSGDRRMAGVRAEVDCELLSLSRTGFQTLVTRQPKALGVFARTMAERLARSARGRVAVASIRANAFVTMAECADAVSTADSVMLNLKITHLYHRIALDLTVLLGAQDVNWFGFACRASKTAGSSIRGEDLPLMRPVVRLCTRWLPSSVLDRIRRSRPVRSYDAAVDAVGERIAEGNRLIFSEIGPVFVRLVESWATHGAFDRERLDAVLAALRPGAAEAHGQDLLRGAVVAYYQAAFEPHPKRRAELVLLGSLKIGLHEQVRVDPLIDEALDRPMADLVEAIAPWLARLPRAWRVEERARAMLCRRMRRLITARMMRIRLPYSDLRLGDDLPRLPANRRFPDLLAALEDPDLAQLFERFDRGLPTRAIDWADLDDRMRYIANFFRSRQKSLELFEPPFLFDQQLAILSGRVPEGQL